MGTINEKIKEIRKHNGWTQAYIANRLGISQPAYQKIETGDTDSMRVSTLRKICKEFNLSADDLLDLNPSREMELLIPGIHPNAPKGQKLTIPVVTVQDIMERTNKQNPITTISTKNKARGNKEA